MQTITEKTLIPLSLIVGIIGTVIGGVWWLSALYSRVSYAEENINRLQDSNKEIVKQLQSVNETLIQIKVTLDNSKHH